MDRIVRDSSLWKNTGLTLPKGDRGDIKIGIVRNANYSKELDAMLYQVEVTSRNRRMIVTCRQMSRFGDVYNYEEWGLRDQKMSLPIPHPPTYQSRVGEIVVVAPIDGNYNEGIIVGSLRHPSRAAKIKSGVSYASEFNGLETTIADTGAYKITFKGTPIPVAALAVSAPGTAILPAAYNPAITGSYFTFTDNGSFEVNDAMLQSIKITKPTGKMTFTSGAVTMELSKLDQKYTLYCKTSEISALKSWSMTTLGNASIFALKTIKIASPKIAIGFGKIELIDTVIKLVDAIGTVVVNSPVGPCNAIGTSPMWAAVQLLKGRLLVIKGSL